MMDYVNLLRDYIDIYYPDYDIIENIQPTQQDRDKDEEKLEAKYIELFVMNVMARNMNVHDWKEYSYEYHATYIDEHGIAFDDEKLLEKLHRFIDFSIEQQKEKKGFFK